MVKIGVYHGQNAIINMIISPIYLIHVISHFRPLLTFYPIPRWPFSMVLFTDVTSRLLRYPDLCRTLTYKQVASFFDIALRLTRYIKLISSPRRNIQPKLPFSVCTLISVEINMAVESVNMLWDALADLIFTTPPEDYSTRQIDESISRNAPALDLGESID